MKFKIDFRSMFCFAKHIFFWSFFFFVFSTISVYATTPKTLEDLFSLAETPEQAKENNPPGYAEAIQKLNLSPEDRDILLTLPYQIKMIGLNINQAEAEALVKLIKNPGKIKFACMAPMGTPWAKYIREVPKLMRKRVGNVAKVEAYIGLSLGNDPDYVVKMASGSLEAAALTTWGLRYISKEIGVFELPFIFETYGEADYVTSKTWNQFTHEFEKKGFTLLPTPLEVGFLQIYSTKDIIALPEDLKGSKYGSWMGEVEIATLKALNINPVVFTVLELPSSLACGVIESQSAPTMYMVGAQILSFIEKGGGCSGINIFYPPAGLVIHKKNITKAVLANMGASDRELLSKYVDKVIELFNGLLAEISPMLAQDLREGNKMLISNLKKKGMNVYIPTQEERKIWKDATKPVWNELAGKVYSQETLELVLKHKSDYRATHPQEFENYTWTP